MKIKVYKICNHLKYPETTIPRSPPQSHSWFVEKLSSTKLVLKRLGTALLQALELLQEKSKHCVL